MARSVGTNHAPCGTAGTHRRTQWRTPDAHLPGSRTQWDAPATHLPGSRCHLPGLRGWLPALRRALRDREDQRALTPMAAGERSALFEACGERRPLR